MNFPDEDCAVQEISLLECLDRWHWLKLLWDAVRDVGPASQTLAAFVGIATRSGESFVPVSDIASQARLPIKTVRKHLVTLAAAAWIENKGRQKTKRGWLRRTATLRITAKTREALEESRWGYLPAWACCTIRNMREHRQRRSPGRLSWSARVVGSVVMSRLLSLKSAAEKNEGHGFDLFDIEGAIENMGGDDRFSFSLSQITADTGLDRKSVIRAKRELKRLGIIGWYHKRDDPGRHASHMLVPNPKFLIRQTPAKGGGVYLDFLTSRKSA
jgi:DNA-binding MarR family transcriptional regulator